MEKSRKQLLIALAIMSVLAFLVPFAFNQLLRAGVLKPVHSVVEVTQTAEPEPSLNP